MRKILTYALALLACLPVWGQRERLENLLIDAVADYDAGNIEESLALLQKLNQADTTNDAVYYYSGLCEFARNNPDKGLEYVEKASSLDPSNTWYRSILASEYLDRGDVIRASELLEVLLEEMPQAFNNPYALSVVADARLRQRKDTLALDYYERALELDPDYAPAELGKADVFIYRGNYPAYFVSIGNVIHNSGVFPEAKSKIITGILERIDGRFYRVWGNQIKNLISDCIDMHPDDFQSRLLKIQICFIEKDLEEVIRQCRSIVSTATASGNTTHLVQGFSVMGDAFHELGDVKSAFMAYDSALKADPAYAPVLNNYAYDLCLTGKKYRKALKMAAAAVEAEPDNATYLDTYAWILHLLHRDAEAKPVFKHAMIYGGRDNAVVLEHYAEVLRALGETDLADYYRTLSGQK